MLILAGLVAVALLSTLVRVAGPSHRRRWLGAWLHGITPRREPRLFSLHRVAGYPGASRRLFPC